MIDKKYKVELTGKIAKALGRELEFMEDVVLAKDHLGRLRALRDSGIISRVNYRGALMSAKANNAIKADVEAGIENELTRIDTSESSNRIAHSMPGAGEYNSQKVLVPASYNLDIDGESSWFESEGSEKEKLIEQLSPIDGRYILKVDSTSIYLHHLPWFENALLLRLTDKNWGNKYLAIYYIASEGSLYRLNGTSPPIHDVNAKAPININIDNVVDYLRFFCFFVRGEEGPFHVIDRNEDPFLSSIIDEGARNKISSMVSPVDYKGQNEKNHHLLSATIFYSNAIFIANFAVHPSGMIEMLDDEPLVDSLNMRITAPIA